MYQANVSERQAVIAEALSTLATTTKPVAEAVADAIEAD